MQKIWNWIRKNAGSITATGTILGVIAGIVQFGVINPIHQRFDDMNQRFDDMNQRFDDMNQRFDHFRAEMNTRFEAQDKYINQRFDAVDQRFDNMDERIDRLTGEVSELRKLTVSISERVSRNEGQIDVIRQQLQTADAPSP